MPQLELLVLKARATGIAGHTRRLPRGGVSQLGDRGLGDFETQTRCCIIYTSFPLESLIASTASHNTSPDHLT